MSCPIGGRRDLLPRQCVEEREQKERIPSRPCLQRCREERVWLGSEAAAGQHRGGLLAEAAGANDRTHGVRKKLRNERWEVGLQGGACSDKQQQRQPFEPTCEIDEPTQRRLVGPVQVVYHEQRRSACGEVGGQPVEPVQDRERRLGTLSGGSRRRRGKDRRAQPGRAGK